MTHHSMLAFKIFTPLAKMIAKTNENNEGKTPAKPFHGKKRGEAKKREKGPYKGPNRISLENLENYQIFAQRT